MKRYRYIEDAPKRSPWDITYYMFLDTKTGEYVYQRGEAVIENRQTIPKYKKEKINEKKQS